MDRGIIIKEVYIAPHNTRFRLPDPASQSLLDLTDRCVKCGLCLPHCPTYELSQDEAESPRGRIALLQGMAAGMIQPSERLTDHIDGCLSCRSCETVCPAQVSYGEILDQGRAALNTARPQKRGHSLLHWLASKRRRSLLKAAIWLYQKLGVQKLMRSLDLLGHGALARAERYIPETSYRRLPRSETTPKVKGRVALFTGCASEVFDSALLQDAHSLLLACGYDVEVPKTQQCCGALYQHHGDNEKAQRLAQQNIAAFSGSFDAVVGTASGCTSMLREYSQITGQPEALEDLTQDISRFLLNHWNDDIKLHALPKRIAIHDPCTLKNVLRDADNPYQLLNKIPEASISALEENTRCCGAAGSYFLDQPETADQLGQQKLAAILKQQADIIVTSNIGCSMQLQAQLRKAGLTIPVMHPVSLLRQQLVAE